MINIKTSCDKDKVIYEINIKIEDRELENKTDEQIYELIMNKFRREENYILYGKKGIK